MIFIVIPVFNRLNYTIACLESLVVQNYAQYKILVVDHGSTDGTSEYITTQFPSVILLKGDEKMWWTAATNMGVKEALKLSESEDDFMLTLNNDLEVKPDYLTELLKISSANKPCLVGSTSVDIKNPDRITFNGGLWNKYVAKFKPNNVLHNSYKNVVLKHEVLETDLLPGRGALIPIDAFRKLGLYDEVNFPHYSADDDFSLRCKRNGYKLLVAVKAVVFSHVSENGMSSYSNLSFWKQQKQSFTSIRSPVNFKNRYAWASKNTPIPLLYFSMDMFRIVGSKLRDLIKNRK